LAAVLVTTPPPLQPFAAPGRSSDEVGERVRGESGAACAQGKGCSASSALTHNGLPLTHTPRCPPLPPLFFFFAGRRRRRRAFSVPGPVLPPEVCDLRRHVRSHLQL
jgi:hypothetical protein